MGARTGLRSPTLHPLASTRRLGQDNRPARQTLAAAEEDAQLAADVELLFERLVNNWANVQRLLAEMLRERGHWLRYVLRHAPGALCVRISASLREMVRDQLRSAHALMPAVLRNAASALPGVGLLGDEAQNLPAWRRLADLTLTAKSEWRKARGISRILGYEYERPEVRDRLRDVLESLCLVTGLREALAEIAVLPA